MAAKRQKIVKDRRSLARRSEGIDWADWKPKHKLGVFANLSIMNFNHNRRRSYPTERKETEE